MTNKIKLLELYPNGVGELELPWFLWERARFLLGKGPIPSVLHYLPHADGPPKIYFEGKYDLL